jgi:hypothetical protein
VPENSSDADEFAVLEVSAEFERAVGKLVTTFAHLERQLKTTVAMLVAGKDEHFRALVVVRQMTFASLLPPFASLMRVIAPGQDERILAVGRWIAAVEAINKRRNRFVHDAMLFVAQDGKVASGLFRTVLNKSAGGVRGQYEAVELEKLQALSTQIEDRLFELGDMTLRCIDEGVFPETARPFVIRRIDVK